MKIFKIGNGMTMEKVHGTGMGNAMENGNWKCFKGTEGVVGLIRWSEKMETVFHISNCPKRYQVKYTTCTLLDKLHEAMFDVYCLRNEIQKMETELWNLSVKNNDIANYTQRFQELTMMCTKMVPEEEDRVKKFIGGLPDNIQGNVIAAEPTRLQDAVRIANNLMDQKLKGYAVRNVENKRRLNNNYGNNHGQQPPHKRQNTRGQNVARAYMAGNNEKREYKGRKAPLLEDKQIPSVGVFDEIEANDQAIQTILLGLPEDIYAAVDSCETAQEIWLHVQQMMKGSDIRAQNKKAKLFNEWERFTSTDGESIESYYHRFSKLMNDFKRNKHFLEKIASNLKFITNLQPEWKRHITTVRQTKNLHEVDYTQIYDFLKMNQGGRTT
ncbi:reverse transcriptase domain-containing protein [Tanacetum coccineum]